MIYELSFHPDARAEWQKLDGSVRVLFKKKLAERLQNPHVPAARLSGQTNHYKIKLRDAGYRLVYEVRDQVLMVVVANPPYELQEKVHSHWGRDTLERLAMI